VLPGFAFGYAVAFLVSARLKTKMVSRAGLVHTVGSGEY
jgi:hypothetical protein